ncbi:MAG: hypothetical protein IGS03_14320 [Candidatus Sericytochromatia bacterium]|nr:hypothetical protein [Candidatus Sericytochromatia bacterium]
MRYGLALSLLLLSLSPTAAQAQSAPIDLEAFKGAKIFYRPGFAFLGTGELNQSLEYAGFSPYSPTFISHSGSAHLLLDQILIGASGTGLSGFRSAASSGQTVSVNGGYGVFQLGYQIVKENGFSLYPILGIGSGSTQISSSEPLNGLFGLTGSQNVYQMQSSQVVLDLGLGADYLVNFSAHPDWDAGLLVGLRLGYLLVPSPPQWQSGPRLLSGNLPGLNNQGFYVNLSLGLGAQRN